MFWLTELELGERRDAQLLLRAIPIQKTDLGRVSTISLSLYKYLAFYGNGSLPYLQSVHSTAQGNGPLNSLETSRFKLNMLYNGMGEILERSGNASQFQSATFLYQCQDCLSANDPSQIARSARIYPARFLLSFHLSLLSSSSRHALLSPHESLKQLHHKKPGSFLYPEIAKHQSSNSSLCNFISLVPHTLSLFPSLHPPNSVTRYLLSRFLFPLVFCCYISLFFGSYLIHCFQIGL